MRTVASQLKAAQVAGSKTPYVDITIGGTNYWSRLIALEHIEEPYRERASIVLDNSDRALDSYNVDLTGQSFVIRYGYTWDSVNYYLGDGNGSDDGTTLWVKYQDVTSFEGKSLCLLECEGMWGMLSEIKYIATGAEPWYENYFGGVQTVQEIIVLALAEAGMTLSSTYTSDGIVDVFKPYFTSAYTDSLAVLLRRLINMTKSYLRPHDSLEWELVYPQATDDVDLTVQWNTTPYFKEYVSRTKLVLPNDIKVFWGADDDGSWANEPYSDNLSNPGSSVDQDSIDAYTTVRDIYVFPTIETQDDADLRAEAILWKIQAEQNSGHLMLPYHEARIELYDRVNVIDQRGL